MLLQEAAGAGCTERGDRSDKGGRAVIPPSRDTVPNNYARKAEVSVSDSREQPCDCQQCPCMSEARLGSKVSESCSGTAEAVLGQMG